MSVGRRQMRLSYGFEELPNIERAIGIIREAVEYAQQKNTHTHTHIDPIGHIGPMTQMGAYESLAGVPKASAYQSCISSSLMQVHRPASYSASTLARMASRRASSLRRFVP